VKPILIFHQFLLKNQRPANINRILKQTCRFLILFLFVGLLHAEEQHNQASQPTAIDTTKAYREKIPSHIGWEQVAYFPGKVVYFPMKWMFKGAGELVGYIDDTKIIQRVNDKLESDDGRRKLQFTYASHTGGGAKYYQKGILLSRSDRNIATLLATAGLNREQLVRTSFEDFYFAKDLISAEIIVLYQKLAAESFYGPGMGSKYSDESSFSLEQTSAIATLGHNLRSNLRLEALAGYEMNDIGEGYSSDLPLTLDLYSEDDLPGLESEVEMAYGQIELDYDSKDRPGNPTKGYEVSFKSSAYQQVGDDMFGFLKNSIDARRYLHLFYNRVMVIRTAIEVNNQLKGREIPFYYQSELGREETIRGFERGRFRGKDMILASVEYRYPVWHFWDEKGLDVTLFVDTGKVSADLLDDAGIDNFETGYGFGFRLWDYRDGLFAKLLVGWSKDGMRIYLGWN